MYGPVHKHLCEKYQNQNAVKIKSKFEEFFTIKLSSLQSNKSKTVVETDGILEDENKSVKINRDRFFETWNNSQWRSTQ